MIMIIDEILAMLTLTPTTPYSHQFPVLLDDNQQAQQNLNWTGCQKVLEHPEGPP